MPTTTDTIHAAARAIVKATPKPQRHLIAHIHAAKPMLHAAEFLTQAADLVATGARADSPEVVRLVDFAKRKIWQAEEQLAGRKVQFKI